MRTDSLGPYPIPGPVEARKIDLNPNGQFSCVAVEVIGTITAGGLYLKGALQSTSTPVQLYTEQVSTGTSLGDGKITQAGIYRVASAAINHIYLDPSDDYAGANVSVYFTISEGLPPISIVGSV